MNAELFQTCSVCSSLHVEKMLVTDPVCNGLETQATLSCNVSPKCCCKLREANNATGASHERTFFFLPFSKERTSSLNASALVTNLPQIDTTDRRVKQMTAPLPFLPIDVWSKIAMFLPGYERMDIFFRLRAACLIPTYINMFVTMKLFLSEVYIQERARARVEYEEMAWPVQAENVSGVLLSYFTKMGFNREFVIDSLRRCNNNLDRTMHHLLHPSEGRLQSYSQQFVVQAAFPV